ncbi:MAG: hypothetical protein ACOY5R_15335 [Pseudomonadota bacterium]
MVDWAATGAMLQGIGTLAGVGAVLAGAKIAANAWKDQKLAERRLEMAERILTATHKGRRALAQVRSPMMWGHELGVAEENLKEDPSWESQTVGRKKRLITAQAFINRLNRTRDEQIALDECLPMARALFNEDLEKALENLRHQFWIVQVDVESYVDDEGGTDVEFTKRIRRGMYDIKPRNDEINEVSDAIAGAVTTIEMICEPALRLQPIKRTQKP